jgi:hypothetical protein
LALSLSRILRWGWSGLSDGMRRLVSRSRLCCSQALEEHKEASHEEGYQSSFACGEAGVYGGSGFG